MIIRFITCVDRYLKDLFEIAMEDAWSKYRKHLDIRFKHRETTCGPQLIGAQAAEEFYKGHVDAFVGPVCNEALKHLSYMAVNWNIPVITPRGNTRLIRNTTIFPNLISLHPFGKFELIRFVVYLLKKYHWEHLTVFTDKDTMVLETTGKSFYKYLETASHLIWSYIPVYSTTFTDDDYDAKLREAAMNSRVMILIMNLPDVRKLMLRAAGLGMTNGDFVYIVPEFQGESRITRDVWRNNDRTDIRARKAFRSVLFINVLSPPLKLYDPLLGRLNYKLFGDTFLNFLMADNDEIGDETTVTANDREVQQAILAGYYNAIMIYLQIANETLAEGQTLRDGQNIVKRITNRTFDGIAGKIHINSDGHRDTDMALVDMTDPFKGKFERVGVFQASIGELVLNEGAKISWPGDGAVKDIPECGFQDKLCIDFAVEKDSEPFTIGLSTGISVIIIAAAIAVVFTCKARTAQRTRDMNWWKISLEELQAMKRNLTRSTFSSSVQQSKKSVGEQSVSDDTVVMYKGNLVKMEQVTSGHFQVTQRVLKEFDEIRDMNHPNLMRLIGACFEGEKPCIVTEYCPKGTLQELLVNDSHFELDLLFQTSLITDIVQALMYIHKRALKVHGRLSSETCMIDSRFSVKVGMYGMSSIYETMGKQNKEGEPEKTKLWTAPENLRNAKASRTPESDIYSLGIIISEIISREEPFSHDREYLTVREILYKIQFVESPPFRPAVTCGPELYPLETLMKQCWEENPDKRPSLASIAHILTTITNKCDNKGSLVDNLLQRLEKYSTNLEKILADKVEELQQEKHKSEELLQQMLPKMVADKLKAGLSVDPELYECVTIYFSDIVGFTEMCSVLKPVQIINLLNDLYSCFDGIIGNYDVFKIETIGDAYMVVSGLPTRNGNEHARQIARMSLSLVNMISTFTPIETSEDRIMLRIGLHSGPVCAGVVGLKMPRYCLFGESVNIASAMEANGMEWKIHMSSSTAEILRGMGDFLMKRRGETEVKGKGTVETYWLLGETDTGKHSLN